MRSHLRFLLLDGFDPDTGELALRVGFDSGEGPQLLRIRLHLGRGGDALQPLRRQLSTLIQMPLPPRWDKGLKLILRAIEDDLAGPDGREPGRYRWVQTQILHPTDDKRSTLNHPVARQVDILWAWAQKMDQEGDSIRCLELLESLLLLAPRHSLALAWMASLLRNQGMVEEMLEISDRLIAIDPGQIEAQIRRGEALLHLERPQEAWEVFNGLVKVHPLHVLAHLGAAQAQSLLGADPFPHLDAALELDRETVISVLKETFDFRLPHVHAYERTIPIEDLPGLLGVSLAEVRRFVLERHLPLAAGAETVWESELSRWVLAQNRYQLLDQGLHWSAPTPRAFPPLGAGRD